MADVPSEVAELAEVEGRWPFGRSRAGEEEQKEIIYVVSYDKNKEYLLLRLFFFKINNWLDFDG